MDTPTSARPMRLSSLSNNTATNTNSNSNNNMNKTSYSSPASPISQTISNTNHNGSPSSSSNRNSSNLEAPTPIITPIVMPLINIGAPLTAPPIAPSIHMSPYIEPPIIPVTPKKGSAGECTINRYRISAKHSPISAAVASKTPASYRHLIDLTSSNIKCEDVHTGEMFLCKIVNEPLHKVQRAYFALKQDVDGCRSSIYGHTLIREIHDIVPMSKNRTYIIISSVPQPPPSACAPPTAHEIYNENLSLDGWHVYEDLHTYIRNKRRLREAEARSLFHQICQTVQICHRNGIILRDLKLKRFYFIDKARTKLQYESLEGSMILDDVENDVLSDKIGCPLYTAPELLCPHPTYHGKPADMWSLGVILYTMLVGQYPFYEKGNCNLITIIRHCHVQIPSFLSRSVRWLLLALLRKNYEDRMTSSQIFISPWLKEQRPFYTYVPVDVDMSEVEEYNYDQHNLGLMNEDDLEMGVQPLDYTVATLSSSRSLVNNDIIFPNNTSSRNTFFLTANNSSRSESSTSSTISLSSGRSDISVMNASMQDVQMS